MPCKNHKKKKMTMARGGVASTDNNGNFQESPLILLDNTMASDKETSQNKQNSNLVGLKRNKMKKIWWNKVKLN